ncbi:DUF4234 domain-containing protein [Zooshikella marina]|uniref:DUF4234 domain-containing protein n=1 Tax=Zooshikella ganghwensis TaxID=202772 RepID=UPI001BAF2A9C|nr:DUF4234 domain-containing protein [Zooshikella ganghwensis]MBU2705978.1 DUF4234 domain-containing protein [Zooshikella ganghwensis]
MSLDSSPYTAPSSDISTNSSENDSICQLPRVNLLIVFSLIFFSLGIYYYYWMFSRTKIINRVCDRKISPLLSSLVVVLFVGSLILGLYLLFAVRLGWDYDSQIILAESVVNYSCLITSIFWLFAIRDRLHYMCKANKRSSFWMNWFFTFLGAALYLQYKINQVIDHKEYLRNLELNDKFQPSKSFDDGVLRATR